MKTLEGGVYMVPFSFVSFLIILVLLVVWLIPTIWIGVNQRKYKGSNGLIWMVINIFVPFVGLGGYILNRTMVVNNSSNRE